MKLLLVAFAIGISGALAETACQQQRRRALTSGLIGAHAPICEKDGSFSRMQCREAVCYCVDPITGVAVEGSHGHVSDFDQINTSCMTDCQRQSKLAVESGLMGAFVPKCEADGSYSPFQCREAVCFCADTETGKELEGSRGHVSDFATIQESCTTGAFAKQSSKNKRWGSECEMQREDAQHSGLLGTFIPVCDKDGSFHHTQCHGSVCYCVDPDYGTKREGTEQNIGNFAETSQRCESFLQKRSVKSCQEERDEALSSGLVGRFVPRCAEDGSYHHTQCHGSVCYCVDKNGQRRSETGKHISNIEDLSEECQSYVKRDVKSCQEERDEALSSGLLGRFVPRCAEDGSYHHTQCHGSVCYCVDKNGQRRSETGKHISNIKDLSEECQSYVKREVKTCAEAREEGLNSRLLGRFIPKCESDGSYRSVQCHETGCFCVNPLTGESIDNTAADISEFDRLKQDCSTNTILARRSDATAAPTCENKRVAYRWNKCPAGCKYFQGYGEALIYCCCDAA